MAQPKSIFSISHTAFVPERRRYPRFPFISPVRLKELNEAANGIPRKSKRGCAAKIKNLGQGGAKITALAALMPQSKVLMDANLKSLSIVIDTRNLLFVSVPQDSYHKQTAETPKSEKQILTEVAWRYLNLQTGLFEAGLRFIEEWRRRDYESYITSALEAACA